LWLWVDSPEHQNKNSFSFFSNSSFCRIFRFFFSHPISCFCHVHSPSCPARHTPPPPTPLHTPLVHIPPYPSPAPVALMCCPNPLNTLPFTLEFSFCFFSQALLSSVWRPDKTYCLRATRDRCPPGPLTPLPYISGLTLLPFPPRQPCLDCSFDRSFSVELGQQHKKVSFLLPLPCCLVSALAHIPPNLTPTLTLTLTLP
jgi:hypothetical protein